MGRVGGSIPGDHGVPLARWHAAMEESWAWGRPALLGAGATESLPLCLILGGGAGAGEAWLLATPGWCRAGFGSPLTTTTGTGNSLLFSPDHPITLSRHPPSYRGCGLSQRGLGRGLRGVLTLPVSLDMLHSLLLGQRRGQLGSGKSLPLTRPDPQELSPVPPAGSLPGRTRSPSRFRFLSAPRFSPSNEAPPSSLSFSPLFWLLRIAGVEAWRAAPPACLPLPLSLTLPRNNET